MEQLEMILGFAGFLIISTGALAIAIVLFLLIRILWYQGAILRKRAKQ